MTVRLRERIKMRGKGRGKRDKKKNIKIKIPSIVVEATTPVERRQFYQTKHEDARVIFFFIV